MKNAQDYIEKAGFDFSYKSLLKVFFWISVNASLLTYGFLYLHFLDITHVSFYVKSLLFHLGVIPGYFLLLSILFFALIDYRIMLRKHAIEKIFPEFLHSVAANIRAGMPTDRAIWQSVTPQMGVLGKEIELVAKENMTGVELGVALEKFSKRYDSKLIQRSISIIIEGISAGSKLEELLKNIALNLEDLQIRQQTMAANLTSYIFFISFAVLIAAPLMFGFASQFLSIVQYVGNQVDFDAVESSDVGISFSQSAVSSEDFFLFCMINLFISSVMASVITSQIATGKILYALPKIPVYFAVSVFLFWVSDKLLAQMFSSVI